MKGAPSKSIGLIGFMGTGKTTIGKALAESLGWVFVDTDDIIEERAGKSISEIFSNDGEESFRRLEVEVVREVCNLESSVISFGGGALLDHSNLEMITRSTTVVLLRSSAETVISRSSSLNTRPLLNKSGSRLEDRVNLMMAERESSYSEAMEIEIDTDVLCIEEAVNGIIRGLGL
ncbi:MAG: shikimate kinase [Candidatus Hermodarchaeota archaeon]